MKEKSYFGLSVYSDNEKYILESDIKNHHFMPFGKRVLEVLLVCC
ncbi:hypothetical protein [Sulfurimonas sp.]|jgi:hypothetical protein|nr:hypothetical protein [Sulfurimonas sp.]